VKSLLHLSLTPINWRIAMPVQMIELEEVQTLNIDDDRLAEIVTKSKAQYGNTADEYVEGCQ
jgi:hypothetical protein